MTERHVQLLRHVGLYRVSLRGVLRNQPFGGKTIGNVLQSLRDEELLVGRKGLGRTLRYYQLTRDATALLGLPEDRSLPFGGQALRTHLAMLSFCCMGRSPRTRLENTTVTELFPNETPPGEHCLDAGKTKRVYRVYVPGEGTSLRAIRTRVRELLDSAAEHRTLGEWMSQRRYAFAILVDSPDRRAQIWDFVRGKGGEQNDEPAPMSVAHFAVETVPRYGLVRSRVAMGDRHALEKEAVEPENERGDGTVPDRAP